MQLLPGILEVGAGLALSQNFPDTNDGNQLISERRLNFIRDILIRFAKVLAAFRMPKAANNVATDVLVVGAQFAEIRDANGARSNASQMSRKLEPKRMSKNIKNVFSSPILGSHYSRFTSRFKVFGEIGEIRQPSARRRRRALLPLHRATSASRHMSFWVPFRCPFIRDLLRDLKYS